MQSLSFGCFEMEVLPNEILCLIFLQLDSLKSVQSCFSVNARWKSLVQSTFKDKSESCGRCGEAKDF